LLILDAGSGIFPLWESLHGSETVQSHLLITRRHWDHINGLPIFEPLFEPLFDPRTRYRVYGGPEDQTGRSIEHVLAVQFQKSYFPIFEAQLAAGPDFRRLTEAETFDIADARVSTF